MPVTGVLMMLGQTNKSTPKADTRSGDLKKIKIISLIAFCEEKLEGSMIFCKTMFEDSQSVVPEFNFSQ